MIFELDEKQSSNDDQYLYRYEDDNDQIRLRKFKIIRETNCGWWIHKWSWYTDDNLKFVYKTGKNNFAKKTKKEAIENYYHRKCRHVAILNFKLIQTRNLLNKAKAILEGESNERINSLELQQY